MHIRGSIPSAGLADGVVTVTGGVITEVSAAAAAPAPAADVILPGLIDIHCHGGGGHSFCTSDPAEALAAAAHHAAHGTTGIVASIVTAAPADMIRQVALLAPLVAGGHLLGIHLEGPFLSAARCGAQAPEYIRDPDPALAEDLLDAGGGAIKLVTIAPERAGAPTLIRLFRSAGVTVALGHTDADYQAMASALAALEGSGLVTHLANGMPPLHHRSAGPAAAALVAAAGDTASVELIADGVHVDAGFTRLVFAAAAPGRVVLITDATAAAGMADGEYELGPQRVRLSGGVARLVPAGAPGAAGGPGAAAGGNTAIAGGTRRLLEVVATARAAGVPLADAVRAAAETPARVLGVWPARGGIAPGMAADLVVTDSALTVQRVMRAGQWLE